jgi:hypothetical protein
MNDYTKDEIKNIIHELEIQLSKSDSDFGFWSIQSDLNYWRQRLFREEN